MKETKKEVQGRKVKPFLEYVGERRWRKVREPKETHPFLVYVGARRWRKARRG
jgi:hypothetical protein